MGNPGGQPLYRSPFLPRVKGQQCCPPEPEMGKRHRSHTDPQWWYKEVSTFQELEIQPTSSTPSVNRETEASTVGGGVFRVPAPGSDLCPLLPRCGFPFNLQVCIPLLSASLGTLLKQFLQGFQSFLSEEFHELSPFRTTRSSSRSTCGLRYSCCGRQRCIYSQAPGCLVTALPCL